MMENKQNPLQNYNTEAYVPEDDRQGGSDMMGPMTGGDLQTSGVSESAKNSPKITEEEARLLLQEETRKTEQKLLTAEQKNKKFLKIALIVAAIICIAGVVFAVVMGNMRGNGA